MFVCTYQRTLLDACSSSRKSMDLSILEQVKLTTVISRFNLACAILKIYIWLASQTAVVVDARYEQNRLSVV